MPVNPSGMQTSAGMDALSAGFGSGTQAGAAAGAPVRAASTAVATRIAKAERMTGAGIIIRAMGDLSRRQFGTTLIATLPFATVLRAHRSATVVGVITSAFSDLPRVTGRDNVDEIVRAVRGLDVSHVELA